MKARLTLSAATLLFLLPMAAPVFAMGESGGSDPAPECKKGEVWDKKLKKCVVAKSGIDDESLYEAGRDLALAGRYDEAVTVLALAADKTEPRILTYLGYAHRKAGRINVGLGYYREALRQNADYLPVREYLGEAYLQLGDVAAAKVQLGEIEKRGGTDCVEYAELAKHIAAYES